MNLKEPLHFIRKAISLRKTWNLTKAVSSYGLSRIVRRPIVWGLPPGLMIEPTNFCNLRCPLCPSGNGSLTRERGFMDYDLYTRVIDEVRNRILMVLLWNQGESFLHKRFLDMVRYASDAGLYTLVSTNGHYFSDPEAVVRSGMDSIIISLDGATADTYKEYRIGGNFEKVIDGTRALVEAKHRLGSKTPIISVQLILFKHNEHEIGAVHNIAARLGADRVTYKTAQVYDTTDIQTYLPDKKEFRRYEVDGEQFRMANGSLSVPNRCWKLWSQPVVNWDGSVAPCCFDKNGDFSFARVGEGGTLAEIWKSRSFNAFRKRILTDRTQIEMCRNCTEGVKTFVEERDVVVK